MRVPPAPDDSVEALPAPVVEVAKRSPNTMGAAFMMLSMGAFVVNDTIMKIVLVEAPFFQAILIRGAFASVLMALFCWYRHAFRTQGGILRTVSHPMVILRVVGELGGTFFFLTALTHLPIANISAILQILPLTMTLAAALFLGEKVGWRRYGAIAVGFVGVMLIIRPGTEGFTVFSVYALISTAFITLRDIATRQLPASTSSLLVSLLTAFAVCLMGAVGTLVEGWQALPLRAIALLALAASIVMTGYIFSIMSMRVGEVSFVAPFRYSILLWALLLGYFVFGDIPDSWALAGATLVVGSGLFSFHRERRLARQG